MAAAVATADAKAPAAAVPAPAAVVPAAAAASSSSSSPAAAAPQQQQQRRVVEFVVTGFGEFQGVVHNPSELLVNTIAKHHHTPSFAAGKATNVSVVSCTVLEVSRGGVNETFPQLCRHTPAHNKGTHPSHHRVYLHFGVHGRATSVLLEQCAYNDATFRCADQRGDMPVGVKIRPTSALGHVINTDLDVVALRHALNAKGHSVEVSHDPGRFLCNFVYYTSLARSTTDGGGAHSLFVHVPPLSVIGADAQYALAVDLMQAIAAQVLACDEDADAAAGGGATATSGVVTGAAGAGAAGGTAAATNGTAAVVAAAGGAGAGAVAAAPAVASSPAGDVWAKST